MARDDMDPRLKDPSGRDMTQAEGRMSRDAGQSIRGGEAHSVDQCSTLGCGDSALSPQDEAKRRLEHLIQTKRKRLEIVQQEAADMFYLQALLESLPTRLSHEAAMGLNLLTRAYGNTPLRY